MEWTRPEHTRMGVVVPEQTLAKKSILNPDMDKLVGYENEYQINRLGQIWSCWYGKMMTPAVNKGGYLYLNLKKGKRGHKGFISRLLAIQYLPNPDNLPEVDHIDRNRQNNSLDNLRWVFSA